LSARYTRLPSAGSLNKITTYPADYLILAPYNQNIAQLSACHSVGPSATRLFLKLLSLLIIEINNRKLLEVPKHSPANYIGAAVSASGTLMTVIYVLRADLSILGFAHQSPQISKLPESDARRRVPPGHLGSNQCKAAFRQDYQMVMKLHRPLLSHQDVPKITSLYLHTNLRLSGLLRNIREFVKNGQKYKCQLKRRWTNCEPPLPPVV
jgi:hypothetical protein